MTSLQYFPRDHSHDSIERWDETSGPDDISEAAQEITEEFSDLSDGPDESNRFRIR